jgi:3-hydroxybutyryl-CoA dehydrogenase
MTKTLEKIAVLGAGSMGQGIAHVAALAGYGVALFDLDSEALDRAQQRITKNLNGGVERGKIDIEKRDQALNNIVLTSDLEIALIQPGMVIEAVPEDLDLKRSVLQRAESLVEPPTILASNTSSLPLTKLAEGLKRPEQLIGAHFFNPVHIMKLVEVVIHPQTSILCKERTLAFSRRLGKEPIVVKDSPGFASSRLGVVLGLEAIRMVEEEVASPEDIDKAMELGYRHPMGPLRLTDLVGLDVRLSIAEVLHKELGGEQYQPPKLLREKVAAGDLGQKSGKGFYSW